MINIVFAVAIVLLLSACGTKPQVEYVTKTVFVEPPQKLRVTYKPIAPPHPSVFETNDDAKIVGILLDKLDKANDVIANYELNVVGLNNWVNGQIDVYGGLIKSDTKPSLYGLVFEERKSEKPDK